ncbi:hypothetical protein FHX37_1636 [Haloactinospora alba]|uniref:DUF5596 domain-containing protein n=1 Tax=Haloactinospora alba TaxID=405555 RepID=A0A543NIR0_9ACTN|nr:acyltransferase domain-containing protein [Haloactinospora alba]TQN31716.1 hypothetical protein FHX37_1636 [Haloactinospora alba]
MDTDTVVERFGLSETTEAWLYQAAQLPRPSGGVPLPPRWEASGALSVFGLADEDATELVHWWPDDSWPPELWWLLERMYAQVVADLYTRTPEWRHWPALVEADDPRLRCASVFAFAAAVPHLAEVHRRLGVPWEATAATLGDVGRHVAQTRRMFGRVGLETASWIALHFRAGLYALGRLQFEPNVLAEQAAVTWYPASEAASLPAELHPGQPALRVHIPAEGPLDARGVEESLTRARPFFRSCLGTDYPVATCTSWLLDPQLAEYLDPASNIMAFQRRFTLVERQNPGNTDVFRFVFGMPEVRPDEAPQRTRLERAVVEHLRNGGQWHVRTGWLRLG